MSVPWAHIQGVLGMCCRLSARETYVSYKFCKKVGNYTFLIVFSPNIKFTTIIAVQKHYTLNN